MDEFSPGAWVRGCNRSQCPIRNDSSCLLLDIRICERKSRRAWLSYQRRLAGKLSRVSAGQQAACDS
jgi:hypothetical protein